MNQQLIIFDTTLRDGEQSLQESLSVEKKLKIAFALEKLGVDIIEVGFPISSPGDFKSICIISKNIKTSKVCSLARCIDKDIDVAAEAMKNADYFRIHIFLGTSSLHMESKLGRTFNEIVEMAVRSIKRARKYTDDIEFSCEDAGRTDLDNLCRIVEIAISSGATTINIPDTVGYTIPSQFQDIITSLYRKVPNIDKAVISIHCHNDLGMAVANSVSAIQAGARQVEGTINGIGERAGNASLEEVIMAIKVRNDIFKLNTNIKYKEIYNTSQIVSKICNISIPSNKSIVGENVFTHSSGIHQDGVLKNRENYEIIIPETIGLKSKLLNLTSRSGRAAVKHYMSNMGYLEDHDYNLNNLYDSFLKLSDRKGRVFDYDLEILSFSNSNSELLEYFKLKSFIIKSSSNGTSHLSIKILCGSQIYNRVIITKNGLIYAIYKIFNEIASFKFKVKNFVMMNKENINTFGNIKIEACYGNRIFYGVGISKDIFESFIQAMIDISNSIWKIIYIRKKLKKSLLM
ncbi:2-isopropylmalate synthase [Buchnera aphidicola (Schlechtendalia chinensis)]|uniref:2-isopropylmalate synthase n=1 Tax=Buchnera aphidicola subsp. Schlechtendalia chinensis TaxID=118110 RepID=A0A172WE48_BUCSC|nr:2-isopropylmalate synthase [Buchnera aphidicola]ANF17249.1 2-isopropylmalate synthase [Buchnera aphidicola (Schlechtendalia chinensis)]